MLWFGHWRKGAAATVGEEQEQRFAKQSRYCGGTKRMTSASEFYCTDVIFRCIVIFLIFLFIDRIDHLTKGALHGNARIEKDMVVVLPRRLKRVLLWIYLKIKNRCFTNIFIGKEYSS